MQRIVKRYVPYMSVTQGCQVNLRDPKSGQLMHKGWKIMTSHAHLSELMHRPCSCGPNYRHAKCEGGLAGHSAFYTPEFAKRVCHALFHEFSHALLSQEMDGRSCLLPPFGKGPECVCRDLGSADTEHLCSTCLDRETHGTGNPPEAEAFGSHLKGEQTDEEIKRKLYLLHASTGHSHRRNMIAALKRRGAPDRVLTLAEAFECPMCREKQKVGPKNVASLERLPAKFSTISADGGKWVHPQTGVESEFVCIIDEGSRYRVARVLKHGRKQTMSAMDFLHYLQEGWTQYFGMPLSLRVDPAGAFRSRDVEQFCDENGIYLDITPGEAHWQLGC